MVYVERLPLKLVHPEYIDTMTPSNEVHFDLFPSKESLKESLGVFAKLPSYHHKHRFLYCLNAKAYFRESIMSANNKFPYPMMVSTYL